MSSIRLYKNKSDERQLRKELEEKTSISNIYIMENTNVLEPIVILKKDILKNSYNDFLQCNYAYLSSTNRYYFIKNFEMRNGGFIAIYLKCDVLHTYSSEISNIYGLVVRNEFVNNPYYVDSELIFNSGRLIDRQEIPSSFFNNHNFSMESNCIALTVNGGVN